MKKLLLFLTILFYSSFRVNSQNTIVTTFNAVHQQFKSGSDTRTVIDSFQLVSSLGGYSKILMHVDLGCPTGGCDPWDRAARISIKKDNEWMEIGRYMTPYKKACGWVYDVTEYSNILTGKVILNSFIDTWVSPAWLVTVSFEYVKGVNPIPLTKVENIWQNYYIVYGDASTPATLPVINKIIDSNMDSVKLKVVLTGHGQGNTENAAEFSQKTHSIYVNNNPAFSQYLWRANCSSNTCSPQSGTWTLNRAGWCPGASVMPAYFNLSSKVAPNQNVKLEYVFQTFTNTCSPNNVNCITGTTCSDCNYNYNGHTEPYYQFSGQVITYLQASTGLSFEKNNQSYFSVSPNPNNGDFILTNKNIIEGNYNVKVMDMLGQIVYENQVYLQNRTSKTLQIKNLLNGIYFLSIAKDDIKYNEKIVIQ